MRNIAFLCILFLAGCTTVTINGPETKLTKVDYPAIGVVTTAYVGDQLLQKGEVIEEKVLQVNSFIDGALYNVNPGSYQQIGHTSKDDVFSASGVVPAPLSDPVKAIKVSKDTSSELCVVTVFNSPFCYSGDFEIKNRISERGASFQQTLIYSGRVGNKINIGYREFSSNLARPAFNNNVEYDLSTSNVIGYKGAQIEVLSADNNSIKYRVIRNFP